MSVAMSAATTNTLRNSNTSVIKTRRQTNNFMQLHETDPQLPFSDLLLKDLTTGINAIPTSAILDWIGCLLPDLIDFKKTMIDSHRGYTNLKWMLQTSRYVDWVKDHKKQNEATATHWPAPNLATQARLSMDKITNRMLSNPVPGDNGSESAANLRWQRKVLHNLMLTVLMELQTSEEGYFQAILGTSRAWRWPDSRRVQGMGGDEISETAVMPTTRGPKPPKKRKRPRSRAGKLAKGILPRVRDTHSSKRSRKAEPHMSTNAYDTTFDDSHVPDPPSEDESESPSDPEYDPRQDMGDDDDDAPLPAKRPKGPEAAAVETEIVVGVENPFARLRSGRVSVAELKSAGVKALEKKGVVHVKDNVRSLGLAVGSDVEEQQQEDIDTLDPPPSYGASSQRENVEQRGNELSVSAGSGNAGTQFGQQLSEKTSNNTATIESAKGQIEQPPVYSQGANLLTVVGRLLREPVSKWKDIR